MKKYINALMVAIGLVFVSCDSWLDVTPSDQYSAETFWKTKEHAKAGMMGCYNALMPWRWLHTIEFDMLTANSMPYNEANGTQALDVPILSSTMWNVSRWERPKRLKWLVKQSF